MVAVLLMRDFQWADADEVVEILKLNGQYSFPEVDGPEAMERVKAGFKKTKILSATGSSFLHLRLSHSGGKRIRIGVGV